MSIFNTPATQALHANLEKNWASAYVAFEASGEKLSVEQYFYLCKEPRKEFWFSFGLSEFTTGLTIARLEEIEELCFPDFDMVKIIKDCENTPTEKFNAIIRCSRHFVYVKDYYYKHKDDIVVTDNTILRILMDEALVMNAKEDEFIDLLTALSKSFDCRVLRGDNITESIEEFYEQLFQDQENLNSQQSR